MTRSAQLQIDPRLTAVFGETYPSSQAALKELVDKALGADADHVWITLPEAHDGRRNRGAR